MHKGSKSESPSPGRMGGVKVPGLISAQCLVVASIVAGPVMGMCRYGTAAGGKKEKYPKSSPSETSKTLPKHRGMLKEDDATSSLVSLSNWYFTLENICPSQGEAGVPEVAATSPQGWGDLAHSLGVRQVLGIYLCV